REPLVRGSKTRFWSSWPKSWITVGLGAMVRDLHGRARLCGLFMRQVDGVTKQCGKKQIQEA
ncbi:MAG TPA: hypothetical protein VN673_00615, partial [Clostridia bacterium]|nr:hypothetical protein [Clostridia bacterium]